MKQTLFALFTSVSTFFLSAQVGDSFSSPQYELVGEVKSLRRFIRLEKRNIGEEKNRYVFSFSNREYNYISDIGVIYFTASEEELMKFKNYLLKGFELENDNDIRFKLGQSDILILKVLSRTIKMVVYGKEGISEGFLYITPREIPRIFNEG